MVQKTTCHEIYLKQARSQHAVENLQKMRFSLTRGRGEAPWECLKMSGIERLGKEGEDSPGESFCLCRSHKPWKSRVTYHCTNPDKNSIFFFPFFHLGTTEMCPHGGLDLGIICCSKLEPQAPSKFSPPGC